jgi:hypothetical protein
MSRQRTRFCIHGHDKISLGEYTYLSPNIKGHIVLKRRCAECARIKQRERRKAQKTTGPVI